MQKRIGSQPSRHRIVHPPACPHSVSSVPPLMPGACLRACRTRSNIEVVRAIRGEQGKQPYSERTTNSKQRTANSEQQTANSEQQTANSKPQTVNSEQRTAKRTANSKQRTANSEQRTANREQRTANSEQQATWSSG